MHSPLLKAELRYQRRGKVGIQRKGLRSFYRAFVIAGLVSVGLLFGLEALGALIQGMDFVFVVPDQVMQILIVQVLPFGVLLPLVAMLHFGLMFRTLMLASNAMTREKQQGTWMLLLLTEQRAQQIVIGKWWATVLTLAPQTLLLSLLRVGIIIYIGLERYRINAFYYSTITSRFYLDFSMLPFSISLFSLIVGAGLIILFTFINLMFTAALGSLIGTIRGGGRVSEQVAIAFGLRTVLLALPALLLIWLGSQAATAPLMMQSRTAVTANSFGFSLLDNGTQLAAAYLNAPHYTLNYGANGPPFYIQFYLPDIIPYVIGFYVLITLVSLIGAIRFARRDSA